MFGTYAVLYLFLGGAGAGAIAVCAVFDLIWIKQPFGTSLHAPGPSVGATGRVLDFGFCTGFIALVLGIVCLMLDLGRIDRVLALFVSPTLSIMAVGSYALALLGLLGTFLVAVRFLYLPDVKRPIVVVVEGAAVAVAFVVMLYTGLLLQSVSGVAFWASPFVPAMFVFSSLSSGVALLFAVSFFVEQDQISAYMLRGVARADVAVIVLEALCVVLFLAITGTSEHPGARESYSILVEGDLALAWWLGFVVCGLVAPFAIEAVCIRSRTGLRSMLAIVAVLVLAGAFCLRFGIVDAGVHRDLTLEPVVEQHLELTEIEGS